MRHKRKSKWRITANCWFSQGKWRLNLERSGATFKYYRNKKAALRAVRQIFAIGGDPVIEHLFRKDNTWMCRVYIANPEFFEYGTKHE